MPSALERQFHGTCALVRVQLMRAAERSDVEECFPIVRERNLITAEDEQLIRSCIKADEQMTAGEFSDASSLLVSRETIARLHMIVSSRLNVADSA